MSSTMEEYQERMAWIYEELGGECSSCGAKKDFHIHHPNGDKEFTVAPNWGLSKDRLKEELAKCELLCATCHRKVHTRPHGTQARYRHSKCRCAPCREAHRVHMQEYRARRREREPNYRRVGV